jgi:hypothetical protein
MLQQKDISLARKNVVGFHLGPQADFVRYDKTRKPRAATSESFGHYPA